MALPERLREPVTVYVGREAERERTAELWGEACGGSLRVVLLSGEPGIGKTRLSIHLALEVHGEGSTVLYGRCDEDLRVQYRPWVQALSHLVKEAPKSVIDKHVERFGGDLARLIPALRERVPGLPSPRESDPETERYLMYAAVEGLLKGAGCHEPLLLILDDLHWADAPTLSLLRHVVSAGSFKNVMVVGSFRDCDLSRDHPLTSLLAALHCERGVERVKLTGFDSGDMAALMEVEGGYELDEDGRALAAEITRETAGNPFFAGEVLRHLTESGAIVQEDGGWRLTGSLADLGLPQSVREVIGQRVERLGADARTVLSAAAVIGREFDLELLRAVLDFSEDRLLDLLDRAVAASLLQEGSGQAERFTFIHALVVHTLYEDLGRAQRRRLHKRVAEALEEQCGDSPGERLGELARHWAAAVVSADATKAIHYARLAAERALEQLAPEEAARWYRQALELQGQTSEPDRSERCELLIGLGEAQRQTGNQEFRQTLLDAAALAQELGETARLCRAVVANSRGWTSQTGAVDSERVQTLEAAASVLADDDPRRARVLSLLASELHFGSDPARCRAMATQAIAIARDAGDPATLGHTIYCATGAILVPNTLCERKALSEELVELAQPLGDPRLSFMAAARQWVVSLEAGDRPHAESALTAIRALAASVPEPTFAWARLLYETVLALLQGDLQAAEQWASQAFEAGKASAQPDAILLSGAQLANLRSFQDRSGEVVKELTQFVGEPDSLPAWRAAAAIALIESGQADEARELALAEDFKSVRWDMLWLVTMWTWADVCSRLGLKDRAGELYELLQPFPGQVAARSIVVYGSIDWALGALATTLERYEQAEGHFAAAAKIDERFGGPLSLARTRAGWARALIARGRPEDLKRAQQMLE